MEVSLSLHSFFCQTHSHPNYPGSDDRALRGVHLGNAGREMVQSHAKNPYRSSFKTAKNHLLRGCLSISCQKINQYLSRFLLVPLLLLQTVCSRHLFSFTAQIPFCLLVREGLLFGRVGFFEAYILAPDFQFLHRISAYFLPLFRKERFCIPLVSTPVLLQSSALFHYNTSYLLQTI